MSADKYGVSFGFHTADGEWVEASPRTRAAIRRSLGATSDGDEEPADDGAIVLDYGSVRSLNAVSTLQMEDGTSLGIEAGHSTPRELAVGYHTLIDESSGTRRPLIVAPRTCFPVRDQLTWGWAVQMYALRSRQSWGIGEFADLRMLSSWSRARGAGMVLVNPLHAAAPLPNQQPSPYFPTSRCFRNPLSLRLEEVPGFEQVAAQIAPIAIAARGLNSLPRIDRDQVFAAKYRVLDLLWEHWKLASGSNGHSELETYVLEQGQTLEDFATFSAIVEQRKAAWMDWPAELRSPRSRAVSDFRASNDDRVKFHCWVQWLVEKQLADCAGGLDLMTDLAIGVDRGGADAWMWQDSFALDMSVGAPPDQFNTQGQNWGLPPFDPWRLRHNGYEPFIRTIRSAFRHAQALRMDHVMGLFRLYWIPEGEPATNGCYVYFPFRDLLGIVAIESQRAHAYVVGEDLGTVEDYVREELSDRLILSYRLRQFESMPSSEFPENAVAAITTHDLPTIPGFWTGFDVSTQAAMGLQPNIAGTESIRQLLAQKSGVDPTAGPDAVGEVVAGAYRDLATSPCRVLTATLEDALGVEERPNMPGTIDEWPNWRIALPLPLEQILDHAGLAAVADALAR